MYKVLKKIDNIPYDVFWTDKNIIFKYDNTIIKIDFKEWLKRTYVFKYPIVIEKVSKSKIFLRDSIGITVTTDLETYLEIPIKFQGIKQIKLIGESFILFRNGIENKWDIKCIDYSGKLLWIINEKNPVLAQMFGERLVFCHYTAHLLTCHRLSDGGELWRLDVCELGRYERFVDTSESEWIDGAIVFMEAWKNILCLVLGNDKILGIDIETGTIQWQRQMPVRIITAPLFHEGRLYWFSLGNLMQYCVVNMLTGANVQNPQVLSPLFRAGLIFTQPIMHGNKILMTADSSRIIYIVDRQTGLVDFTVPLSGEGSRIPVANAPMIQSNHLYQLDGDNVLHIFEVQNKF